MKKILFLILIAIHFSFSGQQGTDEIVFKSELTPETTYSQSIEQSSIMEMKYSGSKEFLQRLKDKGIENPTITNTHSVTESVTKTGKLSDNGTFPLTIEFIKTTSSDGKQPIPNGTVMFGYSSAGSMPTLDSIAAPGMEEKLKKTLLTSIGSTFEQLSFPERKVKVGERFSIKTPLTIPIAGVNFEMEITTNYKLLSVKNGIAEFDITQVYTMKLDGAYAMKAKGTGKGKIFYDTAYHYNTKYQVNMNMDMRMRVQEVDIALKMINNFEQTVQISKN